MGASFDSLLTSVDCADSATWVKPGDTDDGLGVTQPSVSSAQDDSSGFCGSVGGFDNSNFPPSQKIFLLVLWLLPLLFGLLLKLRCANPRNTA